MRYCISVVFQITVSFDETTTLEDVDKLFKVFAGGKPVSIMVLSITTILFQINYNFLFHLICTFLCSSYQVSFTAASLAEEVQTVIPSGLKRERPFLTHPIFNTYNLFQYSNYPLFTI